MLFVLFVILEKTVFQGNKRKSLDKYQRVVERDWKAEGSLHDPTTGEEMFQPNYDSAWHAVTSDKISRDAKKKPTDVMTAKSTFFTQPVEENKIMRFEQYVNENFENPQIGNEEDSMQPEYMQTEEADDQANLEDTIDSGYEVDEEQLEQLIEEYGDELAELLDKIVTDLEIEKAEAGELLAAAFEKISKEEEEPEENTEDTGEDASEEPTEEGA
jgi:hypothetical protein